jgi:folate-binding protein YgfZ
MDSASRQFEYEAVTRGTGMCPLEDRLIVRVSGDDRISFMQGMCTADVKNLAPGKLTRALFLTERAHVIADFFLYALGDQTLWLEVERPRWTNIREHLERFLVADDVELEELQALAVLDVEGPASIDAMVECFGDGARELSQWQHVAFDTIRVANLPRYGGHAFTIIGDRTALGSLAERMRQLRLGIPELHAETLETLRIESGLAQVGTDTNERTLALEVRLEPAIAFSKGCYVGQETIERATAHGSMKRRLCGLRVAGDEIPERGRSIMLAGKEVGKLTSIARSPVAGIIGLGVLHHSAWPAGTSVSIIGERGAADALVCELPFRPTVAN